MSVQGVKHRKARVGVAAMVLLAWALGSALYSGNLVVDPPLVWIRYNGGEVQAMVTQYPDCVPIGFSCGPAPLIGIPAPVSPARNYLAVWNVAITREVNGDRREASRWLALPLGP